MGTEILHRELGRSAVHNITLLTSLGTDSSNAVMMLTYSAPILKWHVDEVKTYFIDIKVKRL
jgi:hypothetical protein